MKRFAPLTGRIALVAAGLISGCSPGSELLNEQVIQGAETEITAEGILDHVKTLASDEFEGRAPATKGEELTVEYLAGQFEELGLEPGNPDGSFFQSVPLLEITSSLESFFRVEGRDLQLKPPADFVAGSLRAVPEVEVRDSEVVFVGYGVVAPEYGWDDYKDFDLRGKTVLMLVNDPAVPDPQDPDALDPALFNGEAMTYYGRWTYKYEIAAVKGAAAALVIHETGPAGYPYDVVSQDFGASVFDIRRPDRNMNRVAVEGWIHRDATSRLMKAAGRNLEELKQSALTQDFQPISLGVKADFRVSNRIREVVSRNVIARLAGSDPGLKAESIIYMAHWDHLGKDLRLDGDQIFNGALDNATGTAGLLELARAFSRLPVAPSRSILFLAVTAEEQGLLGAEYYASHPLYPLAQTLAAFNMDGLNQWGPTRDVEVIGYGSSTLEDSLENEASQRGRTVKPDTEPEKGYFYRSDHLAFARRGVPSLYIDAGTEFLGKPMEFAQQKRDDYDLNDYHKVSDEIKPDWDLTGAAQDLRLLFRIGLDVAQASDYPEWRPGNEFRAVREAMLQGEEAPR